MVLLLLKGENETLARATPAEVDGTAGGGAREVFPFCAGFFLAAACRLLLGDA